MRRGQAARPLARAALSDAGPCATLRGCHDESPQSATAAPGGPTSRPSSPCSTRDGAAAAGADRAGLRRFRQLVADLGADCYVAVVDEPIVGLVHVTYARHLLDGQQRHLELLVVAPDGRGQGVGGALARVGGGARPPARLPLHRLARSPLRDRAGAALSPLGWRPDGRRSVRVEIPGRPSKRAARVSDGVTAKGDRAADGGPREQRPDAARWRPDEAPARSPARRARASPPEIVTRRGLRARAVRRRRPRPPTIPTRRSRGRRRLRLPARPRRRRSQLRVFTPGARARWMELAR